MLPDAGVDAETRPSNSTDAPAVCTGRCLRSMATVALNVVAGSAGAVAENTDTTSPAAKAPAQADEWPSMRQVAWSRSTARPPMVTPAVAPVAVVALTTPSALNAAGAPPLGTSRSDTSVATICAEPGALLKR